MQSLVLFDSVHVLEVQKLQSRFEIMTCSLWETIKRVSTARKSRKLGL